ncbi:MAG: FAD-dependent oxidoreductase [Hyphomicrobiales bacterium]
MGAQTKSIKIIGAGVAGLTLAAELVEYGCAVSVYDKGDHIGASSCSWYAGGMLAPWCERESAEEPVARLGCEAAGWWQERVGDVVHKGSLIVAQPRDMADLTRFARRTENYEWIDGARIAELEPHLEGRFNKALYFPSEAHLNPRDAMTSLSDYVQEKGAHLHFKADGFDAEKTDITIDTRGLSARDALKDLRGVKGEMLIIRSDEISLARPVRMLHPRIPLYIVPRADGHFMVGATMIESGERGRITARSMIELLSSAYALHPVFGEAEIVEIGTDVRPAFPDNLPRIILQNGTYYINGLYRHGFLLAPAMARMMREVLLEGTTPECYFNLGDIGNEAYRQRATA